MNKVAIQISQGSVVT